MKDRETRKQEQKYEEPEITKKKIEGNAMYFN